MDFNEIIKEFSVVVYGNLERYSDTLSKARLRIFYKYGNRNGSYITDEFAEKLISTLPYAPIKGIYDEFNEDYTDHGEERTEGRIYGLVPANPNFAWEIHKDEDGVEREYACTDVLLYTALYKEAGEILGKAQSMELYQPSIKGEFKYVDGKKVFVFTDGCFLGLQVLGDETEPCFEGSAFFSLYNSLKDLVDKLDTYEKNNLNIPNNNEGGKRMKVNFKLSDGSKYDMIFNLLNPDYNEAGEWDLNYIISEVYDDYALVYGCKSRQYERVYYTKDNESDTVTLGEFKKCFIVDVTESEKQALCTIQALNGGSFEQVDENFACKTEMTAMEEEYAKCKCDLEQELSACKTANCTLEEEKSSFEQKIEEQNNSIATLTSERDEFNSKYTEATEQIESLNNTITELQEYKLTKETEEKTALLDRYAAKLTDDIVQKYTETLTEFTLESLDKELAFELVKSNPSIFSLDANENQNFIPKDEGYEKSDIENLLDKYENK